MQIIIIVVCGFLFFLFSWLWCRSYRNKLLNQELVKLEKEYQERRQELKLHLIDIQKKCNDEIQEYKNHKDELIQSIDETIELKKSSVQKEVNDFKKLELQKTTYQIEQEKSKINSSFESFKQEKEQEIALIEKQLKDFQSKQNAISKLLADEQKKKDEKIFYCVQLDEKDKQDIKILNSIRSQLNKTTNLDKLIYDTYYAAPVNAMVKRVLGGKKPSGIYMITRSTGEIYIGKSTNVADRWVQHCKSCCHVGTISHSMLHTLMERDGLDTFTFQLIEEVEKDKLTEREKYWINFYDSKNIGLNMREG